MVKSAFYEKVMEWYGEQIEKGSIDSMYTWQNAIESNPAGSAWINAFSMVEKTSFKKKKIESTDFVIC